MLIIGLTGPAGAGKDISAEYMAKKFGFENRSGGDILRSYIKKLDLSIDKPKIVAMGNFLRENYGVDFVASRAIGEDDKKGVVYSGFRSPSEAKYVKSRGGYVVYIDAPTELRHQRILERARTDDARDKELLIKNDQQEYTATNDSGENLDKVKEVADYVIINDGDLEDLYKKLDDLAEELNIKSAEQSDNLSVQV
jgi:dephospho-CoA kinase